MTQEEKARAYDKVSKEVKDFFEGRQKMYSDVIKTLEYLFPELKESEDERIRKELIAFLKENYETGRADETWSLNGIERWIAWLEKQDEHHIACNEEQLKVLNEVLNFAANHESPYWNDYIFGTLNSLIKQLKKLKV